MALDPNIALNVRPLEVPNQLAQYAQLSQIRNAQNQNRMAEMQLQEYERARGEEEGLRNYLSRADVKTPEARAGLLKFGKTGREYIKTLTEQDVAALNAKNVQSQIDEREFGTQKKKLDFAWSSVGSAPTPQAAIEKITEGVKTGVFDMKTASAELQQLQNMTPEQYQQYRVQKVMGILDAKDKLGFMLPKIARQEAGGVIVSIQDNPALPGYGKPIAGADIAKTKTFADITSEGQLGVSRGQLKLAQENAVRPVFNAQAGGFITPPTKESPQGKFTPATDIQATKDQQAAVKALKSAGYDPLTGEDAISKLIAKSTSGGLQAGTAAALAFFGTSTEGRKAISALEGTANQIATDLAGGKLGAGISNTDREFIVAALGDVANPMKTADERLSGWSAAKERMMRVGLIPAPKASGAETPAATQGTGGFKYLGKESK